VVAAACGGGGGAGAIPDTTITKAPKAKTEKTTAKFKFKSSEADSAFECKLDKGAFKNCSSPATYKKLDPDKHKFQVRALNANGEPDVTPAKAKWKVLG
jgi:hypothetical protein